MDPSSVINISSNTISDLLEMRSRTSDIDITGTIHLIYITEETQPTAHFFFVFQQFVMCLIFFFRYLILLFNFFWFAFLDVKKTIDQEAPVDEIFFGGEGERTHSLFFSRLSHTRLSVNQKNRELGGNFMIFFPVELWKKKHA